MLRYNSIFKMTILVYLVVFSMLSAMNVYASADFELAEHLTCESVTDDTLQPISETDSFTDLDGYCCSYVRLDDVRRGLSVQWRWITPNGVVYATHDLQTDDPKEEGYSSYEYYTLYTSLDIRDSSTRFIYGVWAVEFLVEDELQFTDTFSIKPVKTVDSVKYNLEYIFEFTAEQQTEIDFYFIKSPRDQQFQTTTLLNSPYPISEEDTDIYGNEVCIMKDISKSSGDFNLIFNLEFIVKTIPQVDAEKIGDYDTSSSEYMQFSKPEKNIESDNPQIISKAEEIIGDESNPYYAAQKLFRWTYENVDYEYHASTLGALYALENLKGDCTEYSTLFIAMCRSVGIPAQLVVGIASPTMIEGSVSFATDADSDSDAFASHHWCEILLPSYGWVPVDPTWAEFAINDLVHLAFWRGLNEEDFGYVDDEVSSFWYYRGGSVDVEREIYNVQLQTIKETSSHTTSMETSTSQTKSEILIVETSDTHSTTVTKKIEGTRQDNTGGLIIIALIVMLGIVISIIIVKRSRTQPSTVPIETKFCINCGNKISLNAEFCSKCGEEQK